MPLDPESHELGRLAGGMEAAVQKLKEIDVKMDAAARDREKVLVEMRTIKHDYRNVDMKVEGINAKVVKLEADTEKRIESIETTLDGVVRWQQRMMGRVSAFGILGAILGWIIVNLASPVVTWLIHGAAK